MDVELKEVCIGSESRKDAGSNIPEDQASPASSRSSTPTERRSTASVNVPLKGPEPPVKRVKPIWVGDKTFKCGDPYEAPYPKVDGDPWEKVYSIVKDHDDNMCDAWMDEIQNLLILAGLFSAIVTAFVIETQTLLQEDPATTTTLFLAHIASQLAANSSFQVPLPSTTLQPLDEASLAHAFRINSFLFLSLVISLATALFGILVLQWIRSYRKRETLSYEDLLGLRQSRYDGLMKWKVPEIVSALPILLQFGLVVFFVGLVDFLHFLYPKLSIVIGVFVGLVILVLVLTTVLPSLILLQDADTESSPYCYWVNRASVCAYQSPQSWIFLQSAYWVFQLVLGWLQCWRLFRKSMGVNLYYSGKLDFASTPFPHQDWTSLVQFRGFGSWTPYSLSWVFQKYHNTAEPFWAAYRCFKDLDTPEGMLMTLHDLAKARSIPGRPAPDKPSIQDRVVFRPTAQLVLLLAGVSASFSHQIECHLRCVAEIESSPYLAKFVGRLGHLLMVHSGMPEAQDKSLKVTKQHLWYFQCSLLQNPGQFQSELTNHLPWPTFWSILDSEWDDLSVITPDEGISLVYKALTSHDAALQQHASDSLPSLIQLQHVGQANVIFGRVISHPHMAACFDFLMTDAGRMLLSEHSVTFVVWLEENHQVWLSIMEEYKLDSKYAGLFSAVPATSPPKPALDTQNLTQSIF